MRTHPIVTTVPTDDVTLASASPLWLFMAAAGAIIAISTAIALMVINSPAYRTIPTLDRAQHLHEYALTPAAALACALLVISVAGSSHEVANLQDRALRSAVDQTQFALAHTTSASTGWDCQIVEHQLQSGAATVECAPLLTPGASDTSRP